MLTSPATSTGLIANRASSLRVSSVEVSTTTSVDGTRASPVSSGLKPLTFCRYSEVKYTYPASTAPISSITLTATRRVRAARIDSGSIGTAVVRSTQTKAA